MNRGVRMGEPNSSDEFYDAYEPAIREWLVKTYLVSKPMVAIVPFAPFDGYKYDLSAYILVDDIFRFMLPDGTAEGAFDMIKFVGEYLSTALKKRGYDQNMDKHEVAAFFRSRIEGRAFSKGPEVAGAARFLVDVKYLGGFFQS